MKKRLGLFIPILCLILLFTSVMVGQALTVLPATGDHKVIMQPVAAAPMTEMVTIATSHPAIGTWTNPFYPSSFDQNLLTLTGQTGSATVQRSLVLLTGTAATTDYPYSTYGYVAGLILLTSLIGLYCRSIPSRTGQASIIANLKAWTRGALAAGDQLNFPMSA